MFLNDHFPSYLAIISSTKNYKPFWSDLLPKWWRTYPWWLPDNVELNEENMVFNGEETDAVLDHKKEVMKATTVVSIYMHSTNQKHDN